MHNEPPAAIADSAHRLTQKSALWLGGLGLVPFLSLATLAHLNEPVMAHLATRALLAYGAVIVSFLGGIRWGLAITNPNSRVLWRLIQSVVPSLTGFGALLLTATLSAALLVVTLLLMLWWDWRLQSSGEAPDWYVRLRLPLSLGASIAIASIWF